MTQNRRRTTAPKAPAKKAAESKAPEPMGGEDIVETTPGEDTSAYAPISERECYALTVLVNEVESVDPGVSWDITARTMRGVGFGVTFRDVSSHPDLGPLLALTESDERIHEMIEDGGDDSITILLWPNANTMDDRSSFGIVEAHGIITADKKTDETGEETD